MLFNKSITTLMESPIAIQQLSAMIAARKVKKNFNLNLKSSNKQMNEETIEIVESKEENEYPFANAEYPETLQWKEWNMWSSKYDM
jgi:Txe/YoeB family toxin of Txe-Axe toxin-antitoxin module